MDSRQLSRRSFIYTAAALGAAAGLDLSGLLETCAAETETQALFKLNPLHEAEYCREAGIEYLRSNEKENTAAVLEVLVLADLNTLPKEQVLEKLTAKIEADYAAGIVVLLKSWYLSRTEARLCALAALRKPT